MKSINYRNEIIDFILCNICGNMQRRGEPKRTLGQVI